MALIKLTTTGGFFQTGKTMSIDPARIVQLEDLGNSTLVTLANETELEVVESFKQITELMAEAVKAATPAAPGKTDPTKAEPAKAD